MKKTLIIAALIITGCRLSAQKSNFASQELKRIADLGRVWGMVNYFHPKMGEGKINTADLIVNNADLLAKDPSAANFQATLSNLLGQLNDPSTKISSQKKPSAIILHTINDRPAVFRLKSGYWYVALPTDAISQGDISDIPDIFPDAWDSSKGVIVDLRTNSKGEFVDLDFLYDLMPFLQKKFSGNTALPNVFERVIYHNGLVPQEDGENNIYYSGWKTMTRSTATPEINVKTQANLWTKPVAFVVNSNTSYELIKRLLALRAANKCHIVFEGEPSSYPSGSIKKIPVADGLTVELRVSDAIFGNTYTPPADFVIPSIVSFDENDFFLKTCISLMDKGVQPIAENKQPLSLQYSIPKVTDTNTGFYVNTGNRLFAIYNFWNAIQYFSPYKKLMPKQWDKVLAEHLPAFIFAKDSVQYNFALRSLISEIHDSHGFFTSPKPASPARAEFGYWPAVDVNFIGDKLYVTSIGKDSLQNKNIKLWDEVTSIDGETIVQCLQKWRWYTATSNESTYKRDIAGILLGGKNKSTVALSINRSGVMVKENLARTGRYIAPDNPLNFNSKYPAIKLLNEQTGYVNMGSLETREVDSMFTLFKNTKNIIFDIRNYPKGTAWSIAPRLTTVKKAAAKLHQPIVTAESIFGGEEDITGESIFSIIPDTTRSVYKGKVIILCNASTQSQAEYSIMMLQAATETIVVGSQTAGADGNVTKVILPGNYRASFSGLEILYPDGTQTQRTGIKVNVQVAPTLKGLQQGKDEVLDRAMLYIKSGK